MKGKAACARGLLLGGLVALAAPTAVAIAQESRSASVARELTALLDKGKLDAVAAKEAGEKDRYVAALYYPGSQLLVIEARYPVPVLLDEKLAKKDHREIYLDLNGASLPESRLFIVDSGANGLQAKREENRPYDIYETRAKRVQFDGDWKTQGMTEEEYMKVFAEADGAYARMLTALVVQARK
jgi:hypothetical protein